MNLHLTGHHLEITPAIREYVSTKLQRITRHFDELIDLHAILEKERTHYKVEASVHARGKETVRLSAGDLVVIETSGGGGFGPPAERPAAAREADRREGYAR